MIKKLIFIFMALLYSTSQVMALQCALECVPKNTSKVDTSNVVSSKVSGPMAMDHSCCHENNKSKNKSHNGGEDNCFHKLLGTQLGPLDYVKLSFSSNRAIEQQQVLVAVFIALPMLYASYRYPSKIPDKPFLKYIARLDLYLLKDQFLI